VTAAGNQPRRQLWSESRGDRRSTARPAPRAAPADRRRALPRGACRRRECLGHLASECGAVTGRTHVADGAVDEQRGRVQRLLQRFPRQHPSRPGTASDWPGAQHRCRGSRSSRPARRCAARRRTGARRPRDPVARRVGSGRPLVRLARPTATRAGPRASFGAGAPPRSRPHQRLAYRPHPHDRRRGSPAARVQEGAGSGMRVRRRDHEHGGTHAAARASRVVTVSVTRGPRR